MCWGYCQLHLHCVHDILVPLSPANEVTVSTVVMVVFTSVITKGEGSSLGWGKVGKALLILAVTAPEPGCSMVQSWLTPPISHLWQECPYSMLCSPHVPWMFQLLPWLMFWLCIQRCLYGFLQSCLTSTCMHALKVWKKWNQPVLIAATTAEVTSEQGQRHQKVESHSCTSMWVWWSNISDSNIVCMANGVLGWLVCYHWRATCTSM
jgi:hypothetical protein